MTKEEGPETMVSEGLVATPVSFSARMLLGAMCASVLLLFAAVQEAPYAARMFLAKERSSHATLEPHSSLDGEAPRQLQAAWQMMPSYKGTRTDSLQIEPNGDVLVNVAVTLMQYPTEDLDWHHLMYIHHTDSDWTLADLTVTSLDTFDCELGTNIENTHGRPLCGVGLDVDDIPREINVTIKNETSGWQSISIQCEGTPFGNWSSVTKRMFYVSFRLERAVCRRYDSEARGGAVLSQLSPAHWMRSDAGGGIPLSDVSVHFVSRGSDGRELGSPRWVDLCHSGGCVGSDSDGLSTTSFTFQSQPALHFPWTSHPFLRWETYLRDEMECPVSSVESDSSSDSFFKDGNSWLLVVGILLGALGLLCCALLLCCYAPVNKGPKHYDSREQHAIEEWKQKQMEEEAVEQHGDSQTKVKKVQNKRRKWTEKDPTLSWNLDMNASSVPSTPTASTGISSLGLGTSSRSTASTGLGRDSQGLAVLSRGLGTPSSRLGSKNAPEEAPPTGTIVSDPNSEATSGQNGEESGDSKGLRSFSTIFQSVAQFESGRHSEGSAGESPPTSPKATRKSTVSGRSRGSRTSRRSCASETVPEENEEGDRSQAIVPAAQPLGGLDVVQNSESVAIFGSQGIDLAGVRCRV
mmetsp:Transcript_66711/g.159496  ORF Transcript_66711/g.159496 Transcript_66711/m.159496 type:complete len:635 (-) Transcript_66711:190-2094(-)